MKETEIVGVIEEPCWCVKCGYMLQHQPMRHEEHYGLLVATCPECATVRPVHSAVVSRTLARGLGAASVSWFFFTCFVWVLGCGFAWASLALSIGDEASQPLRQELADAMGRLQPNSYRYNIPEEVAPQLLVQLLPEYGISRVLLQPVMWMVVLAVPCAVVSSAMAIIGFPTMRRRGAMLMVVLTMLVAAAGMGVFFFDGFSNDRWSTENFGWRYVGHWVAWITLLASATCALLGLCLVRPAARWFLMMMGDPVMQLRAARLWTMDGKTPPHTLARGDTKRAGST